MRNYRTTIAALALTTALVGCQPENITTRANDAMRAQETPKLEHYVERENIVRRQKLFDDPNTISFVYGLSEMGNVLFADVAKGKVTSSTKRLEPVHAVAYDMHGYFAYDTGGSSIYTDEVMQVDGTFGSSDPYVFWFTPEGTYRQWNGQYITSSVPLKLKQPVLNFSDVDKDLAQRAQIAKEALKQGKQVSDNLEVKVTP